MFLYSSRLLYRFSFITCEFVLNEQAELEDRDSCGDRKSVGAIGLTKLCDTIFCLSCHNVILSIPTKNSWLVVWRQQIRQQMNWTSTMKSCPACSLSWKFVCCFNLWAFKMLHFRVHLPNGSKRHIAHCPGEEVKDAGGRTFQFLWGTWGRVGKGELWGYTGSCSVMCSTKAHGGPHCLYASMSDEATLVPKIFKRFRDRANLIQIAVVSKSMARWQEALSEVESERQFVGSAVDQNAKSTRTTDRKEAVMWVMWVGESEILITREANIVWKSSRKITYWGCERYESSWKGILSHWFKKYFWVQRVQGFRNQ